MEREGVQAASNAEAAAADASGGGLHTPPRSHGRRKWGQQDSLAYAEPAAAMQGKSAQASTGPESKQEAAAASSAIAQNEWPAAPFLRRFSAPWVHVSMATAGVALREKQRRYAEAADLLRLLLGAGCQRAMASGSTMVLAVGCLCICERNLSLHDVVPRVQQPMKGSVFMGLGGECCYNRRGEWWVRLSIDTEHMGRPQEALEVSGIML